MSDRYEIPGAAPQISTSAANAPIVHKVTDVCRQVILQEGCAGGASVERVRLGQLSERFWEKDLALKVGNTREFKCGW